jgi:pseudouridine synthase
LILLTDDGDLAHRITHPRFDVRKTYLVKVKGRPNRHVIANLRNGVKLSDGYTQPSKVKVNKLLSKNTVLEISIHEGRNRQIRRMFERVGLQVVRLIRTKIGKLTLGNMRKGEWRQLSREEIYTLFEI